MFHRCQNETLSQGDALESVRNVYLHGKVCRVATGSNFSGVFLTIVVLQVLFTELNKQVFERMLQGELSLKVVLKSSL